MTAIGVTEFVRAPTPIVPTDAVRRRFDASIDATTEFFERHVDAIARTCLEMAQRFERGGRLIVVGSGAAASDAQHVSVEFIHPVIVGKRALPAISLNCEASTFALGDFASIISTLARRDDIALAIYGDADRDALAAAIDTAGKLGLLTISIGGAAPDRPELHCYRVACDDPLVGQEVSETFYHVLWELVHLFLEHTSAAVEARNP